MSGNNLMIALLGAGAMLMTTLTASAKIVCNADGECWHVQTDYPYQPDFGLIIHPDDWTWKQGEHYTWKEHDGRGYWKGGKWTEF